MVTKTKQHFRFLLCQRSISSYYFYFRYISIIVHTHSSKTRGLKHHSNHILFSSSFCGSTIWAGLNWMFLWLFSTGDSHLTAHSVEARWTHRTLGGYYWWSSGLHVYSLLAWASHIKNNIRSPPCKRCVCLHLCMCACARAHNFVTFVTFVFVLWTKQAPWPNSESLWRCLQRTHIPMYMHMYAIHTESFVWCHYSDTF